MIFFAVYAVIIWYAAARFRRRWEAFAWVAAGAIGLILVALFHWRLSVWTGGRIYLRVLQALLYPYTVLVVVGGLYIACLPRPRSKVHCRVCQYDLAGLEEPVCPECGAPDPGVILESSAISRPAAAPAPATPRWPPISEQAVCHHQADG